MSFNPETDLKIERIVDVPRERIWRAWTEPQHLMKWWCPAPWSVVACEIDLRPGGAFNTTFRSPEGDEFPNAGCYLEVVPGERLVWTDALVAGFRPSSRGYLTADGGFYVTGSFSIEVVGDKVRYTAIAYHADQAGRDKHAEMGFFEGWNTTIDQLLELCRDEL